MHPPHAVVATLVETSVPLFALWHDSVIIRMGMKNAAIKIINRTFSINPPENG
jgi:hypothetical protein